MNKTEMLFSLLRSQICGAELGDEIKKGICFDTLKSLYVTSKKYDITAIIASALSKNKLLSDDEASKRFGKELALSVCRYEQMNYELSCICKTFEEEKIPYLPLKGAVIRALYPEEWMRTSCDIDILVKEDDFDRAVKSLCEKLGYKTDGAREYHDMSLFSPSGIHLELHFNILENMGNIDRLLCRVWDYAKPEKDGAYKYVMTKEYLLFHNISHMSYHFVCGGCGIRSFVDLYLLRKDGGYDENKLAELCDICNLSDFRRAVERLSDYWMGQREADEMTLEIEQYILNGGIYGERETGAGAKSTRKGGKLKYAAERIFQPYNIMKEKYPVLKKHKWLLCVYHVKRWFDILLRGNGKRALRELSTIKNADTEKAQKTAMLLDKLGL